MEHTATYSPEDNKLRLYPAHRLDSEEYARVKAAGFSWAPKQELFVAPMWTPHREDLLLAMCGEIGDEDTSLVDRAEAKAERLEDLSARKLSEAESARKAVDAIADNIPFGQPILVGHHSEKHARKDAERIENGMRRAVDCWKAANYWTDRAQGAIRHAKFKERPDVRARRIKGLEADYRSHDRDLIEGRRQMKIWEQEPLTWIYAKRATNDGRMHYSRCFPLAEYPRPAGASQYEGEMGLWSALGDSPETAIITPEQARELGRRSARGMIARAERWIAHIDNRLAYERAMLAEGGGLATDGLDLQVGGRVFARGEWATITKLNKKGGAVVSVTTNARYCRVKALEEISQYEAPTEDETSAATAAAKRPPLCNYPGEGFLHMTRAELESRYHFIDTFPATAERGAYRHQIRVSTGQVYQRIGVFITDEKRKDPPGVPAQCAGLSGPAPKIAAPRKAAPAPAPLPERVDDLTTALFNFNPESGKIRAGIKWTSRQDGPGGECYQFNTLDDVQEHARAFIDNPDVTEFTLVTYSDFGYKGMRTVYKWTQPAPDGFEATVDEQLTARAEQLRAQTAAREERASAAAPFLALEEQLRAGVRVIVAPQLFPTPPELAARVVKEADIQPGDRVLEPEAGTGALAAIVREVIAHHMAQADAAPVLICVELNQGLADRLIDHGYNVHQGDFLEQNGNLGKFDRIVMNPPFINGADIQHIQHARGFLNPGGRLVALCANGSRQREILKPIAEASGGSWEVLPAGSFKEQGTGVNVALLVIQG